MNIMGHGKQGHLHRQSFVYCTSVMCSSMAVCEALQKQRRHLSNVFSSDKLLKDTVYLFIGAHLSIQSMTFIGLNWHCMPKSDISTLTLTVTLADIGDQTYNNFVCVGMLPWFCRDKKLTMELTLSELALWYAQIFQIQAKMYLEQGTL